MKSYQDILNEQEELKKSESLNEEQLNESVAAAAVLISQAALLSVLIGKTGAFDGIGHWIDDKVDSVKRSIKRNKLKKITNSTYEEFASKIPDLYKQFQTHLEQHIKTLRGQLESAIAAKDNFAGDKRTKDWSKTKELPSKIERILKNIERKDFFKVISSTGGFMKSFKEFFPDIDGTSDEQLTVIAKMIKDYAKDGKIKDTYWKDRK